MTTKVKVVFSWLIVSKQALHLGDLVHVGHVDVAGTVTARVAHLWLHCDVNFWAGNRGNNYSWHEICNSVSTSYRCFPYLVSKRGTAGLVAKVDAEVVVELHSSVHRVAVDDEHHRALNHSYWTFWTPLFFLQYLDVSISFRHLKKSIWQFKFWNVNSPNLAAHIRVELLVPGGEERRGDVQSLSIKTQLEGIQMRAPNTQKKYKSKKHKYIIEHTT